MKRIILALLILCSAIPAICQPVLGDVFPPVGGPTDFWHTGGLLTSDRQMRLSYSDTLVLLYKTDGSMRYDTTKKQMKVYDGAYWRRMVDSAYLDTVVSSIEAGAVDTVNYIASITRLDREIDSVTNITDSLYTVLLTKQGADSLLLALQIDTLRNYVDSNNTIIYGNIARIDSTDSVFYYQIAELQSDVPLIDSALGVAFGAISTLYDTLPNYVDTAQLNDSLQAIKAAYVPYTGATTDVNLGTHNILPNSVRLSTTPTGTLTNVGQLYFDATNVTASIPLNANVTMQIGQEMYIRARNNTGVQINDGQVVYINSAQGNNPTIALANSDSVNTSSVIGMATENIADNGTGFVTTFGVVNGYNTSSFTSGDILYLNTVSGQLSNAIPTPPHNVVKVGIALNSTNNGKVFIQPAAPLGQDTTFTAPYNSNKVAPTQRAIGTYVQNIVKDTASALRTAINGKYGTSDTGRAATNIVTGGALNKVRDSLAAISGGGSSTLIKANEFNMLYKANGDTTIRGTTKVRVDTTDSRMEFAFDTTTTAVTTDPHGGVKMWGSNRMGMGAVRINDTVSIPAALQRAINAQTTSSIIPFNFSNPPNALSYTGSYLWLKVTSTTYGTPLTNAYSATIQHLNYPKAQFATSAGANATAAIRTGNADGASGLICGNTKFSGGGGRGTFTFAFPTYASTQRIMIGYSERIDGLTGDPSTFLTGYSNLMIIKDATDSTLFFSHNSGAATTTKVNTGIKPNNEDVYRLTVYIAPNSTFYAQLEVMSKTAAPTVVTINPITNVPPVGDKLVQQQAVNNGTVGGIIVYGFIQHMEEVY